MQFVPLAQCPGVVSIGARKELTSPGFTSSSCPPGVVNLIKSKAVAASTTTPKKRRRLVTWEDEDRAAAGAPSQPSPISEPPYAIA